MSKQVFFAVLGAAAITFSAVTLVQAGEMSSRNHRTATSRHVSAETWRRSYARTPVEGELSSPVFRPSPNLLETGRPPAQPGQW
jgi:hypothetical protein